MRKFKLLLTMGTLFVVLNGCNEPTLECPKPNLPYIAPINKVAKQQITFEVDGSMKTESAQKAYKQLRAYSVSEHYYFTSLTDYIALRDEIMKDN